MLPTTATAAERWVNHYGQRAQDEWTAYHAAQRWFGGIVPLVVLDDNAGAPFHVRQQYVDGVLACDVPDLASSCRNPVTLADLANLICLDFYLGNIDRHEANWLLAADGHLIAIDNEHQRQPTDTLNDVLRPVVRCVLFDDPLHTPRLLQSMRTVVTGLDRSQPPLLPDDRHRANRLRRLIDLWQDVVAFDDR